MFKRLYSLSSMVSNSYNSISYISKSYISKPYISNPYISKYYYSFTSPSTTISKLKALDSSDTSILLKSKSILQALKHDIYRLNEGIKQTEMMVIEDNGNKLGVLKKIDALKKAREVGLDLICINDNIKPVLCRITSYKVYKYKEEKAKKEKLKSSGLIALKKTKGIRFTDKISKNDLSTKTRSIIRFLTSFHSVVITCKTKKARTTTLIASDKAADGHEEIFAIITKEIKEIATFGKPVQNGKFMLLTLVPNVKKILEKNEQDVKTELSDVETEEAITPEESSFTTSVDDWKEKEELIKKLEEKATREETKLLEKAKLGTLTDVEKQLLREYRLEGNLIIEDKIEEDKNAPKSARNKLPKSQRSQKNIDISKEKDEDGNRLGNPDDFEDDDFELDEDNHKRGRK